MYLFKQKKKKKSAVQRFRNDSFILHTRLFIKRHFFTVHYRNAFQSSGFYRLLYVNVCEDTSESLIIT